MTPLHRQLAHKLLLYLRQTPLRRPIIRQLARLHNFSYHMISLFASHEGVHPKHEIMNYHQFFIDNVSPQDTVLDLGSGHGEVAYDIAQHTKKVVGIDNHNPSVQGAKKRYQRDNLSFEYGDITKDDYHEKYDVIILSNVLEHIKNRPELLKKAAAIAPLDLASPNLYPKPYP